MHPDERKEYIADLEAWENLPLPEKVKTPKPIIKVKVIKKRMR